MSPDKPIIYVTRDIERALGLVPCANYRIVTNRTAYSESIKKQYPDFVFLIDTDKDILDTAGLLSKEEFAKIMSDNPGQILVFKNTNNIENIVTKHNWSLLNPSAALAEKIENKISQLEWLGSLGEEYLPKTKISKSIEISWNKKPLVFQWAHGHTGDGTILVNSEKELRTIQDKFPERLARITDYMKGPAFTVNVVIGNDKILCGNISCQITGLLPFTDNQFATVGNDWSIAHSLLSETEINAIADMVQKIGNKMKDAGWKGLFGIDIIRDDESNKIYLIEINARQPASTTFESSLQEKCRLNGIAGLTTFEAHLSILGGQEIDQPLVIINDGAQIIQRVTGKTKNISSEISQTLKLSGFHTIAYANTDLGADLIRVQSSQGILENYDKLNARGKKIVEIISNQNEQ